MTDNKKNAWAAAIASFFIAGWGQVYNGESWVKGWAFFISRVITFCILTTLLYFISYPPDFSFILVIGILLSLFVLCPLIAVVDAIIAFSTARKMNAGEIPFKQSTGMIFWGYPLPVILWTLMIIVLFLFAFGRA